MIISFYQRIELSGPQSKVKNQFKLFILVQMPPVPSLPPSLFAWMAMKLRFGSVALPAIANLSLITAIFLVGGWVPAIEAASIGVNYGTVADNLPPPSAVAEFILKSTTIDRIKLYDTNPTILQAFANTTISVTVTVTNEYIPQLTKLSFAQQWLKSNILPYTPTTNIKYILVGNEVLSTADKQLISALLPAMRNLHRALVASALDHRIKVSTPHSLGILSTSDPPSTGKFRQQYTALFRPLLSFLRATGSPFMINPYPFFGLTSNTLNYALFLPNPGAYDQNTGLVYTNMLDGQLDATFSAMKRLGFGDVDVVIAETGWPSAGDPGGQPGADVQSAATYNRNLIRHVNSGRGTPMMPNRKFEAYIFALFNEDLKPGPTIERNFGLFQPDMTAVYNVGLLRHTQKVPTRINPTPVANTSNPTPTNGRQWCVPKRDAKEEELQANIDYVCGQGVDCQPIQENGPCFLPNTVQGHAAYAMNAYYQDAGHLPINCDFRQTGMITTTDPSYGDCKYKA